MKCVLLHVTGRLLPELHGAATTPLATYLHPPTMFKKRSRPQPHSRKALSDGEEELPSAEEGQDSVDEKLEYVGSPQVFRLEQTLIQWQSSRTC